MGAGGAARPEAERRCVGPLLGSIRGSLPTLLLCRARANDARGDTVDMVG